MKNIAVKTCLCFFSFSSRFLCALATSLADLLTALLRAAFEGPDFFFFAAFFAAIDYSCIEGVSCADRSLRMCRWLSKIRRRCRYDGTTKCRNDQARGDGY